MKLSTLAVYLLDVGQSAGIDPEGLLQKMTAEVARTQEEMEEAWKDMMERIKAKEVNNA